MKDCNCRAVAAIAVFLVGATILLSIGGGLARGADPVRVCTDEDRDYAELAGSGAADAAYDFGLKIQAAVAAEDLDALYDLVVDDLRNGPRREFVQGKPFSEIFSSEWRQDVLAAKPECRPVGWRGYMLGAGSVWYGEIDGSWTIVSINGAATEPVASEPWIYGDIRLTRACFATRWISMDNYEEYRDQFALDAEFETAPGRYIGGPVPLAPIAAGWGDDLSLARSLSQCGVNGSSGTVGFAEAGSA